MAENQGTADAFYEPRDIAYMVVPFTERIDPERLSRAGVAALEHAELFQKMYENALKNARRTTKVDMAEYYNKYSRSSDTDAKYRPEPYRREVPSHLIPRDQVMQFLKCKRSHFVGCISSGMSIAPHYVSRYPVTMITLIDPDLRSGLTSFREYTVHAAQIPNLDRALLASFNGMKIWPVKPLVVKHDAQGDMSSVSLFALLGRTLRRVLCLTTQTLDEWGWAFYLDESYNNNKLLRRLEKFNYDWQDGAAMTRTGIIDKFEPLRHDLVEKYTITVGATFVVKDTGDTQQANAPSAEMFVGMQSLVAEPDEKVVA